MQFLINNKAILVAIVVLAVTFFSSPAAAGTDKAGIDWLAAKSAEPGITTTASGLMYKVLEASTNPDGKTPLVGTPCACHYAGTLIDGTEFDSSYKRGNPTTFAPNQVIKGWTEAMQLMKEGDTWELYLPSELAYGDRGAGRQIPGGAVLVFKLNLIEVKGAAAP